MKSMDLMPKTLPRLKIGMRVGIQNYLKLKKPTCVNLNTMSESRIRWIKGLHGFLEVKRIKIREISAIRLIRVLTLNWIKRLHG